MFQVILIFQLETNFFLFFYLFYVLDNFRFIYSCVLTLTPFLIVEMKEKNPKGERKMMIRHSAVLLIQEIGSY